MSLLAYADGVVEPEDDVRLSPLGRGGFGSEFEAAFSQPHVGSVAVSPDAPAVSPSAGYRFVEESGASSYERRSA